MAAQSRYSAETPAATITTTASFRDSLRTQRCLIPADAFYDWKKNGKAQQPFCFEVGDGEMFAFAGLWERWIDPQGKEIESCTIITTTPNSHLADIHDRMPVILPSAAYASWLTPAMRDSSVALTGSRPLPVPCDDTR